MASGVSELSMVKRARVGLQAAADGRTASSPAAAAIEVRDLRVRYGLGGAGQKTILDGLTLHVEQGEFVVLLGQTGCGKSTLLRLLLGQEQPESGSVVVAGSAVKHVDSRSGYVPQRYSLFPNRTVIGNLMIGPEMSRYHMLGRFSPGFRQFRRSLRDEALEQLRKVGLEPRDAEKYPHQLSGGMQQRVAIAQALMMRPRILLMDEAFSALDPGTRSSLQHLLRDIWEDAKPTVVFVTHNTAEALFLGTRVVVLSRPARCDDEQGARVALDMKLPENGMTFAKNGKQYLDLAEYIEGCSRGALQE